ncbi:hypothetical protein WN51_11975 [Melipona quadrifasciata]|uniref:N-acetyltransferase domain-containing protein n=1 Tax=Melipona quadrifasciata TaxID=166423 RepID=A0A0N0BH76_9HYME|nr:hypothetical protein WN51_11975 [Melipona quadrifasciata]
MKAFMNKVFEQMENEISFCALQEGTNDLVGVLVASTLRKRYGNVVKYDRGMRLLSTFKCNPGETLRQILLLRNYVVAKAQFYKVTNVDKFVCVDVLYVKPDHQNNGVGTALLRSCVARASYLAAACVGQFTSGAAQTIDYLQRTMLSTNRLDFKTLYQLPYEQLSKRKSRFEIFQACYPENYSIACMAVQLSPPKFQLPITFDSTSTKTQREDYEKRRKTRRKEFETRYIVLPGTLRAPSWDVTPVIHGISSKRPCLVKIMGSSVKKAPGWTEASVLKRNDENIKD